MTQSSDITAFASYLESYYGAHLVQLIIPSIGYHKNKIDDFRVGELVGLKAGDLTLTVSESRRFKFDALL